MRFLVFFFLFLTSLSAMTPASSAKLIPGSYNLEWRIPAPDEDSTWSHLAVTELKPMTTDEMQNYSGLSSEQPYWATIGKYVVIIDRSKRGKGYNVAYLIPEPSNSKIDLSQQMSLSLGRPSSPDSDSTVLRASLKGGNQPYVDVNNSDSAGSFNRKAAMDLNVQFAYDETGNQTPLTADLSLRGGYYGRVKSDSGDLDVRVIDSNANGVFNDQVTSSGPGDALSILRPSGSYDVPVCLPFDLLPLGKTVLFDGRLYKVSVSADGDRLDIMPFTGTMGNLEVAAKDGNNKPLKWCQIETTNRLMKTCSPPGTNKISLPTGEYACCVTIWPKSYEPQGDNYFGIVFESNRKIKIKRGKTTKLSAGGPIRLEIEPGFDGVQATCGEQKYIELAFSVRNGHLNGFFGGRSAAINVRDTNGKTVSFGKSPVAWGGSSQYLLKAPDTPGKYKICVSFDPTPYQGTIYTYKTLIVTQSVE